VGGRLSKAHGGPARPRNREVAKAYYSTVFDQPAPEVWKIVRDFNNYGAGESWIEDGKSGDTVGAIRNVLYQGRHIRQRLLAQSDVERSQTYEFCGAASLPLADFQATLRITPVADGDRAFVEWWATFDCDLARRDELTGTLRGGSGNGSNRCAGDWRACPPGSSRKTRLHRISGDLGAVLDDFGKSPSISEYPADSGSRTSCCIRGPHLA